MKRISVETKREPIVRGYDIYDDYIEFFDTIILRPYVISLDLSDVSIVKINNEKYVDLYGGYGGSTKLLTQEAYKQMLEDCKIFYRLHESDLIRTQKNSNCRYTGDKDSIEEVIEYMRNSESSWLPQIYKEIDKDIDELQQKMDLLKERKATLQNDDYLISKITQHVEITVNEAVKK